jgi:hypothetical protein
MFRVWLKRHAYFYLGGILRKSKYIHGRRRRDTLRLKDFAQAIILGFVLFFFEIMGSIIAFYLKIAHSS